MNQPHIIGEMLAPIVLFVYKRPWHTEQTLRALKANDLADESVLYVYSDSPKHLASDADVRDVAEVRRIVRSESWCKEVHVIESRHNKGLVTSFVDGITEVVERHGKVIVLEDDQVTSPGFLKYMNEALDLYSGDERVMHVSAYMYPADFESRESTFFLQVQSCPGWGTWKRAWDHYNHDAADHLKYFISSKESRRKFDIEGHARCFKQLERNAGGELYSFAVRWHASCIRMGGLSLFPARSLVQNIGCDGTGLHCGATNMFHVEPVDYLTIRRIPIVEDMHVRAQLDAYFKVQWAELQGIWAKRKMAHFRRLASSAVQYVRRPLRALLRAVVPEFRDLDVVLAKECGLLSWSSECIISKKAKVMPPYRLEKSAIGDYTHVMENSRITMTKIGKFCSIGSGFTSGVGIFPLHGVSTAPMFYSTRRENGTTLSGIEKAIARRQITIGNDVHIGSNVTILDGAVIGDGAVVETGCVVSGDVPAYAVVEGNPMRVVRYRLGEAQIARLREIAWWDWPARRLHEVERRIFDVDMFIEECERSKQDVSRKPIRGGCS